MRVLGGPEGLSECISNWENWGCYVVYRAEQYNYLIPLTMGPLPIKTMQDY